MDSNDELCKKQLRFHMDRSSSTDSTSTVIYCPTNSDITSNSQLGEIQDVPQYSSQKQSFKKVVCEECDMRVPIEDLKKHLKSHNYTIDQINDFMKTRCKLSAKHKKKKCNTRQRQQLPSNKPVNGTALKLTCKICNKTFSSEEPIKRHLLSKHMYTFKMADNYLVTGQCQQVQTEHMIRNNREICPKIYPTDIAGCKTNSKMLSVAIMGANNHQLNEEQAMQVKQCLQNKIINEANSSKTIQPLFTADSIFADGALKLWCKDESTWNWLSKAVKHLSIDRCPKLILKAQCEINTKLVNVTVVLRNINISADKVIHNLIDQNKWAKVNTWIIMSQNIISETNLLLVFGIPDKLFPVIKGNNMCLSYNMSSVILRPY